MATDRGFDLVIFDLDGTLVETGLELCDAVNDVLAALALPGVPQAHIDHWIGNGTRALLVQALAHSGRSSVEAVRASSGLAPALELFDHAYRKRCGTRSRLYPHVGAALHALRASGVRLALLTNKDRRFTDILLDAHHLAPLFDCIVCGDTLGSRKPDPAGVAHCLQVCQVVADRALFVGDSSIDVATARNAGIAVWALPYGYNLGQPIVDSRPDRVIDDLRPLLDPWPA